MARSPRVLVVYKKDAYRQYIQEQRDLHLLKLLRRSHPNLLEMQRSHEIHERAIETVVHALRQSGVPFDMAARADISATAPYQLVVSIGGDGTFLQAARSTSTTPILGVNSNPQRSEAVFSAATPQTFAHFLKRALAGKLPELRVYRLGLKLNGQDLPYRATNDLLLAHDVPATMSRYLLRIGPKQEYQKSSGIWIATAPGSSSAALAAGGVQLPWGEKQFQYRPRELYAGRLSQPRLKGGILPAGRTVRITWLMRQGVIFLDGPHVQIPLRYADELEVRLMLREPLRVLGLRSAPGGRRVALEA